MAPARPDVSGGHDAAIGGLPHGVCHLLDDVVQVSVGQTFCQCGLSHRYGYRRCHAAKVVNMGQQRCAWLTYRDQA